MRFPDVHGEEVVFVYAGDLWKVSLQGGPATRLTSHPGTESAPKFSPDGTRIAFTGTYDGSPDLYVISSDGGEPMRLTYDPGAELAFEWQSNSRIGYTSTNSAWGGFSESLWFVDAAGGVPTQSPILEATDGSFSPDGQTVAYTRTASHAFNWRRYRGGTQGRISFFNLRDLSYSEMPQGRENNWFPMWIGSEVYFVGDKNLGTVNLYRYNPSSKKVDQLTRYNDADIKWPSTDGKTIVFERDGFLWRYRVSDGSIAKITPRIVGDLLTSRPQLRRLANQVASISLSPSGNRVALEARGNIYSIPAKNGDTRMIVDDAVNRERTPIWSPNGRWIAYLSDASGEEEIWIAPQRGDGAPRKLTSGGPHVIESIDWSPDSRWISITSRTGRMMIVDAESGQKKEVYKNARSFGAGSTYDWSPDSTWIAYLVPGRNLFGALWIYDVLSGKSTQVTEGFFRDDLVSFDQNGKYLYLVSSRTFQPEGGAFEFQAQMGEAQRIYVLPLTRDLTNPLIQPSDEEPIQEDKKPEPAKKPEEPKPAAGEASAEKKEEEKPKGAERKHKIDFEGLADRLIALPMPVGSYSFLLGLNNAVAYIEGGRLMRFDLGSRQSAPITPQPVQALSWSFNPARTKAAYYTGSSVAIIDLTPNGGANPTNASLAAVDAVIDPRVEWRQIFRESWRFYRDRFYDPQMLGLDWNAIGRRYEAYLPYVAHRSELNYILGLMIGELGTGHAYVGGGDSTNGMPMPPPVPVGSLGADYERSGGFVRFKKIYRGDSFHEGTRGPLTEVGLNVKEGDYLLAIDGRQIRANQNPSQFLVNKVGRAVSLRVNDKPSDEGARTVIVRPIADDGNLRYVDWVEANRRRVSELSGGRIGYVHVPNTGTEGFIGMARGFYAQSDKDAFLIDERFNGGGDIAWYMVERLARQVIGGVRPRYGEDLFFPWSTPFGPKAMLINERAGSGGDLLPWMFREAKLGPLIGKRTWGGLVGISGSAPLVDGGFLTSPEFGLYDHRTGKWIAENEGVEPDVDVDLRPDALARGQDLQLEAGVKALLDELRKNPPARKKEPTFPRPAVGR